MPPPAIATLTPDRPVLGPREPVRESRRAAWLFALALAAGVALRLLITLRGHNYDFQSCLIVAGLMRDDANVYANTVRYNYGPGWFLLLQAFDWVAMLTHVSFRLVLVCGLSLADGAIALALRRTFGTTAACLFLFNPISIAITGYHNQFDNIALALGMLAVLTLNRRPLALALVGASLATKHLLFAFPLWLAAKERGQLRQVLIVVVPCAVFLVSFLPYWAEGRDGIIQNVFLYRSRSNGYLYRLFVPEFVTALLPATVLWMALLAGGALAFRRWGAFESLLIYSCLLIATSPAITNQYLAIPIAYLAVRRNASYVLYTIVGSLHLLVNFDALHVQRLQPFVPVNQGQFYALLTCILLADLAWLIWKSRGQTRAASAAGADASRRV